VVADGHVGEIDDHVGSLGQTHQQPVGVIRREVDGSCEKSALVADLPRLDPGDAAEVEDEEPRLAAVKKPQSVAAPLDSEERPRAPVDHDHVAEELRIPDRRELAIWDVVLDDAVEERTRIRVKSEPSLLKERSWIAIGISR
jgi:hypothetical protein